MPLTTFRSIGGFSDKNISYLSDTGHPDITSPLCNVGSIYTDIDTYKIYQKCIENSIVIWSRLILEHTSPLRSIRISSFNSSNSPVADSVLVGDYNKIGWGVSVTSTSNNSVYYVLLECIHNYIDITTPTKFSWTESNEMSVGGYIPGLNIYIDIVDGLLGRHMTLNIESSSNIDIDITRRSL